MTAGHDEEWDRRLAVGLLDLVDRARSGLRAEDDDALGERIVAHLGCAVDDAPAILLSYDSWEHLNVHRGLVGYLARHDPDAEWFGIAGPRVRHQDLVDVLDAARRSGGYRLGAVGYATVATGPDTAQEVISLGVVCTRSPDGAPVVLALRGPAVDGDRVCVVRLIAATAEAATATRAEFEAQLRAHDAFVGQVLSFDLSETRGNGLVSFLPRPALDATDVVLPDGLLDTVERHVIHSPEHAARLRAAGQHLKRGVLLHGPPGTGKTHTVRYLIGRAVGYTVVLLSGRAIGPYLAAAVTMARRAQPAIVVVEDVDLIAGDRDHTPHGNPLLFELLNRIDGLDGDADVTFLFTTNRVEHLERALSQRPGRVDLAVEVPLPDADGRLRLLRRYAADVELDLPDDPNGPVAVRSHGVTASFVRELVRRAVSQRIEQTPADLPITLGEHDLLGALDQLDDERHALTRAVVGGPQRVG